ncbi:thioesterase family protein [Rhodococcus sp. D2-41]|uniref:thioesterase family protein n=1 Tax=Speluncibacter jeojiensis TaxID=2710754 RepID=UPI00240F79A8|nr:thioesterase family protein [Rhodococcus sp. D2-41]MDG3011141.1 thioesterase family protein [Rhodococcus sp. D2-41]
MGDPRPLDHEPFYRPLPADEDGIERFAPSPSTISLWAETMQHGSPPAALLVRALERCCPRENTRLTRVSVEILGPVPLTEIRVRSWIERPGRNIELVAAELLAHPGDGTFRPVASARGWRMAAGDTTAVESAYDPPMPAGDGTARGFDWGVSGGYLDAVDWHWVSTPGTAEPGRAWIRTRAALVADEPLSQMQNLFAVVDVANGVGSKLDFRKWTFLNTDLTVHLHRVPVGDWIGISAETSVGPDGVGMCAGILYDESGPVGRSAQTVLVRSR